MTKSDRDGQPRRKVLGVRASDDEKELLQWYADIRGETLSDILRQMGVDEALSVAEKVRQKVAS